MKTMLSIALARAFGALCLGDAPEASAQQEAQVNDAALEADWWVGNQEFGADDMAGAIQRIGSQDIIGALKLVKQGKAATLGKIYAPDIPFVATRNWKLTIPAHPAADHSAARERCSTMST